jgi:hypothetical protein
MPTPCSVGFFPDHLPFLRPLPLGDSFFCTSILRILKYYKTFPIEYKRIDQVFNVPSPAQPYAYFTNESSKGDQVSQNSSPPYANDTHASNQISN